MVLFIFIIMLLDLNNEKPFQFRSATILGGLAIPILFAIQILGVIQKGPTEHSEKFPPITEETLQQAADGFALKSDGELLPASEQTAIYRSLAHQDSPKLPDTNLIGETIFKHLQHAPADHGSSSPCCYRWGCRSFQTQFEKRKYAKLVTWPLSTTIFLSLASFLPSASLVSLSGVILLLFSCAWS
jgi:hypothetical protein